MLLKGQGHPRGAHHARQRQCPSQPIPTPAPAVPIRCLQTCQQRRRKQLCASSVASEGHSSDALSALADLFLDVVEDEDEASIQDASEGILGEHALPPEMAAVLNHLVSQVPPGPYKLPYHCTNCMRPLVSDPCPSCGHAVKADRSLLGQHNPAQRWQQRVSEHRRQQIKHPHQHQAQHAQQQQHKRKGGKGLRGRQRTAGVALVVDECMLEHRASLPPYPERPERIAAILNRLEATGLTQQCVCLPGRDATDTELHAVHTPSLVRAVQEASLAAAAPLTSITDTLTDSNDVTSTSTSGVSGAGGINGGSMSLRWRPIQGQASSQAAQSPQAAAQPGQAAGKLGPQQGQAAAQPGTQQAATQQDSAQPAKPAQAASGPATSQPAQPPAAPASSIQGPPQSTAAAATATGSLAASQTHTVSAAQTGSQEGVQGLSKTQSSHTQQSVPGIQQSQSEGVPYLDDEGGGVSVCEGGGASEDDDDMMEPFEIFPDTLISAGTYRAARRAAGSSAQLATQVLSGLYDGGVVLTRPPGHQASRSVCQSGCVFNNAAVAAVSAREAGAERVLILDWDFHHGQGTQEIFEEDDSVLYISLHRVNDEIYPGTGQITDVGSGEGRGYSVNIAWQEEAMGDAEYLQAMMHIVLPICFEYAPDIVIVSAGFSAAPGDVAGDCRVSPAAFAHMTHLIKAVAPVVMLLEGGYSLDATARCVEACVRVLLGERPPPIDSSWDLSQDGMISIMNAMQIQCQFWQMPLSLNSWMTTIREQQEAVVEAQAEALEQQYDNGEIDEETYTEQLGELATSVSGVTDVGEGEETDELRELVTMRALLKRAQATDSVSVTGVLQQPAHHHAHHLPSQRSPSPSPLTEELNPLQGAAAARRSPSPSRQKS